MSCEIAGGVAGGELAGVAEGGVRGVVGGELGGVAGKVVSSVESQIGRDDGVMDDAKTATFLGLGSLCTFSPPPKFSRGVLATPALSPSAV